MTWAISLIAEVTSGTDDETTIPSTPCRGRRAELKAHQPEQLGHEEGVLVGGPLGDGRKAPMVQQISQLTRRRVSTPSCVASRGEQPEHRLGVSDVEASSMTVFVYLTGAGAAPVPARESKKRPSPSQ